MIGAKVVECQRLRPWLPQTFFGDVAVIEIFPLIKLISAIAFTSHQEGGIIGDKDADGKVIAAAMLTSNYFFFFWGGGLKNREYTFLRLS